MIRSAFLRTSAALAIACSALAGCGSVDVQNESVSIPGGFPGLLAGYLAAAKGLKPIRDCTMEAAALAMQPSLEQ